MIQLYNAQPPKKRFKALLLALFLTACSQVSQIPENESELFQTLKQDRFDDGYTPIVDSIETPLYRFHKGYDLTCGLRAMRFTLRGSNPGTLLTPVDYFLKCHFTNRQLAELKQVTDHNNHNLEIAYSRANVFSDGKKNSTEKITQQEFLITLNQESLVQSLQQGRKYSLTLKSTDISQRDLYLEGIQLEIPARLLKGFYAFSAITWPEAKAILE